MCGTPEISFHLYPCTEYASSLNEILPGVRFIRGPKLGGIVAYCAEVTTTVASARLI